MALIHEALVAIMRETEAIGKEQENRAQGFKFRGIDDVMNSLHSLFAKHGVFISPDVLEHRTEDRLTKSGATMVQHILKIRYTFVAADGSSHSMSMDGESADSSDKGTSKAVSISLKYLLLQAFLIPTIEEKDPDYQSPQLAGKAKPLVGSKLTPEQQQVLDSKMAEKKAERAAAPAGNPNFDILKYFTEMKKRIGEHDYRRILGVNGYEKSNQIPANKIDEARRIYAQMAEFAKEMEAEKDLPR